jgi:signal peptidase I
LPFGPNLFSGRIFFRQPKRGDVVVFKLPRDDSQDYIKRLVGLPGDHIQVIHRELYINGQKLDRQKIDDFRYDHYPNDNSSSLCPQYVETFDNGVKHQIMEFASPETPADNTAEFIVPDKSYFMMGDDRDNSLDSRFSPMEGGVGFVPEENLVGRADVIFFSQNFFAPRWSSWWQFWNWQYAIRWDRIFSVIH